jgi:general secretion pathway protein E
MFTPSVSPVSKEGLNWHAWDRVRRLQGVSEVPPHTRIYGGSASRDADPRLLDESRRREAVALIQSTSDAVVIVSEDHYSEEATVAWAANLRAHGHAVTEWLRAPSAIVQAIYERDAQKRSIRDAVRKATHEAPVLLDEWIAKAIQQGASDVDIEVDEDAGTTDIYFHLAGGRIVQEHRRDTFGADLIKAAFSAITLDERTRNKTPWSPRADLSGVADVSAGGRQARIRLQQMVSVSGFQLNVRILDYAGLFERYTTLQALGFSFDQEAAILTALGRASGLALFCGATGSGKTTALSVAVRSSPKFDVRKWVSIEDPPEIRTPGIFSHPIYSQGAFGGLTEVGDAFTNAMRNVLRFKPDGVLPGEIRDRSSADLAIALALSGHVSAATLHASDPFIALRRMSGRALDVDPAVLAEPGVISLIASMRLVPKLCPNCSLPADTNQEPNRRVARALERAGLDAQGMRMRNDQGCDVCRGASPGYAGRRTCASVVSFDRDLTRAYAKGGADAAHAEWVERRPRSGRWDTLDGRTIDEHMMLRVAQGECDPADLARLFPDFALGHGRRPRPGRRQRGPQSFPIQV